MAKKGTNDPQPLQTVGDKVVDFSDGVMSKSQQVTSGTQNGYGFMLRTDLLSPQDPLMTNDARRRQYLSGAQGPDPGQPVQWVCTRGLLELGGGMHWALPIVAFPSGGGVLQGGFVAGTLMSYRSIYPQKEIESAKPQIRMPTTADTAKQLCMGSEYEMMGQGMLHGDANFSIGIGPVVTPLTLAGLATGATVDAGSMREISLHVTALDGKGNVRVVVRKLNRKSTSVSAYILFGLIFRSYSLSPIDIRWLAKYFSETQGSHSFESIATAYTSLMFTLGMRWVFNDAEIAAYDFDLNDPLAAAAYNDVMHLSVESANACVAAKRGVKVQRLTSNEKMDERSGSASLFRLKLVLLQALQSEKTNELAGNGINIISRENIFKAQQSSNIFGRKSISWESITVRNGQETPFAYFRCHAEMASSFVGPEQIELFTRFATSLGAKYAEPPKTALCYPSMPSRLMTNDAEVVQKMDVYFTGAGVKRIQQTVYEDALENYLDAAVELNGSYKGLPRRHADFLSKAGLSLLKKYRRLEGGPLIEGLSRKLGRKKLSEEYQQMFGRALAVDAVLFSRAEAFARRVEQLKLAKDEKQLRAFFTELGSERHFDYMETIVALQKIAHVDETLVHELSAEGCGVSIRAVEAPGVTNPIDGWLEGVSK
jgi:hypothetical protein